jgi:hypothetical protein
MVLVALSSTAIILGAACRPASDQGVKPGVITFNANGGWCWYQDERVVVDNGQILFGTVASPSGNVEVTAYDLASGRSSLAVLHARLETDDHDAPSLLVLPDGRYLAAYSKHGGDRLMRWRISTRPGDAGQWEAEQSIDAEAKATYSNLFRLSGEDDRIYNFYRGAGWDPNFMISRQGGRTWDYGGRLLHNADDPRSRMRPYLKYASNNVDTIHFITTEAHPANFEGTSIYHGYLRGGKLYRSDGALVPPRGEPPADPTSLTKVFAGDPQNRAWTSDIHLDAEGRPYVAYSVHKSDEDHRYRYARWDGKRWWDYEIAFAGRRLYDTQTHYTGIFALDPNDPAAAYVSTDVHPATGEPLISSADGRRHYEIFGGITADRGATWSWRPLTENSSADNIRPVVPVWDRQHTAVLWLRGEYRHYRDYDLEVVGIIICNSPIHNNCQRAIRSASRTWQLAASTAAGSKPQWTRQCSQRGSRPGPSWSQSVDSISSR